MRPVSEQSNGRHPVAPAVLLHPLAWWVWAGGIAVALTRVGNPVVIAGLIGAVIVVALACRPRAGDGNIFARTLEAALVIGVVIVLVRTGFYVLVGFPDSSPVLFKLPSVEIPWFTNLHILGSIHVGGLVQAVIEGLRLAGLVITFGAASALSNPRRALRHLPSSLHHLGTSAVIAVAAAPGLVAAASRVRRAQQLRAPAAAPRSRWRGWIPVLIPVLAGALDQSLNLAGSMDSRGYARATKSPRWVGLALIIALLAAAGGTYGLLDATTPASVGLALMLGGFALAAVASMVASRAVHRTKYWTTPWGWREMLLITIGAAIAAGGFTSTAGIGPWRYTEALPTLPLLGGLMILAALLALLAGRSQQRRTAAPVPAPEPARHAAIPTAAPELPSPVHGEVTR